MQQNKQRENNNDNKNMTHGPGAATNLLSKTASFLIVLFCTPLFLLFLHLR